MKSKGCSRFNNIYVSCNLLFKNGKKKINRKMSKIYKEWEIIECKNINTDENKRIRVINTYYRNERL